MPEARLVQLLEVKVNEGEGVHDDPVRGVLYYFTKRGELVARVDQWEEARRREATQ